MKYSCYFLLSVFIFSCSSPANKDVPVAEKPSEVGLDWITVEPGNDGYKILMPKKPEAHTQSFESSLGQLKMTVWECKTTPDMKEKDDNEQYSFSYVDYPYEVMKNATAHDVRDFMNDVRYRLAINLRGDSLLSLTYPDDKRYYMSEQIRVDLDGGNKISIQQYFFIKNRLYILGAVTATDKRDNPKLLKFMESFRLPYGKTLAEAMADNKYQYFLNNEVFKMGGGGNLNDYYSSVLDFDFHMTTKEFDEQSKQLARASKIRYDASEQRYYYTIGENKSEEVKCYIIPSFLNDTLYQVKLLAKENGTPSQNKDTTLGRLLVHFVDKEALPTLRFNMINVGDMYVWFSLTEGGKPAYGYNNYIPHQALYLYNTAAGTIASYTEMTKVKYMNRDSLIRPGTGPL